MIGESLAKELSGRASKPPVSKVKCVLDLNQHELSTIQEVESPASGRISMPGKQGDKNRSYQFVSFLLFLGMLKCVQEAVFEHL